MNKNVSIPKYYPKGEVLRKTAERYPEIDPAVMEIMRHVKRLSSGNECVFQADLEPYRLSEGRFYVLCCLFAEEIAGHKAPSPSEIAEQIGVTRATITGLLDGLERDGYLERRHDSADRRALTIHMAAKGREVLEAFIPQQCRRSNAQMACLSPEEKQTLIALLSRIQS